MKAVRDLDPTLVSKAAVGFGLLFLALGLALAFRLVMRLVPWEPNFTIDFDYQSNAALAILRGEDPYGYKYPVFGLVDVGYAYPPLMAWSLTPLVYLLPGRLPYLVWVILEMCAFATSLVVALRAGRQPVAWHWVVLVVGAAFTPFVVWFDFYHGQLDFMLLLLGTLGFYALAKGRPVLAGLLLATAANGKPFLVVLLLYLAWRCHWRAFFTMGFAGLGILVATFLPLVARHGLAVVESWLGVTGGMGRPPFIGFPFNHSIYGTLVRLFSPTPFAVPWADNWALVLAITTLFALVGAAAWLLAVPPGPSRVSDDVQLTYVEAGLLLSLIFAIGPVVESNHLLNLCPAMISVVRLALTSDDEARRLRWRPAAWAWAVFLLLTAGPIRQLTLTHSPDEVPSGLMILETGAVGVLLLFAALATAWSLAQEHRVINPELSIRGALERLPAWRSQAVGVKRA